MPYPTCGSNLLAVSTKEECESSGIALDLTTFNEGSWDIVPPNTCWINTERKEANWNQFSSYDWTFVCVNSGTYSLQYSECAANTWVKSESDCRAAATALGASFGNVGEWQNLPPEVCWGDSNQVHWNTGPGWIGQIICKPSDGIFLSFVFLKIKAWRPPI